MKKLKRFLIGFVPGLMLGVVIAPVLDINVLTFNWRAYYFDIFLLVVLVVSLALDRKMEGG